MPRSWHLSHGINGRRSQRNMPSLSSHHRWPCAAAAVLVGAVTVFLRASKMVSASPSHAAAPEELTESTAPRFTFANKSQLFSIQLLHPLKTGGSTLGGIFQRYAVRHNSTSAHENCERTPPGTPSCVEIARKRKAVGLSKVLNVVSLRNPLDRVVSNFFQDGPCNSNGNRFARQGFLTWLKHWPFASNLQFRTVGGFANANVARCAAFAGCGQHHQTRGCACAGNQGFVTGAVRRDST